MEPLCAGPVTTSAVIAALHRIFTNEQNVLPVDSTSSITVSSQTSPELVDRLWQHAFRQTEDELLLLYPAHDAAPSTMESGIGLLPGIDSRVLTAWAVVEPFLTAMTPTNLHQRYHCGASFAFSLNSRGDIVSSRLALADQPLQTLAPLLQLSQPGHRAFDVFYHLIYSQEHRSEYLQLKSHPHRYDFLRGSNTYSLPEWVTTADDHALGKDWSEALIEVLGGSFRRSVLCCLSGILLLGQADTKDIAEGAALVGIDPTLGSQYPPRELAAAAYVALLQSLVAEINEHFLTQLDLQPEYPDGPEGQDINEIASVVTIVECSPHDRANVLKSQFDDQIGLNAEMAHNGLELPKCPPAVAKELRKLKQPVLPQLSIIEDLSKLTADGVTWARSPGDTGPRLDVKSLLPATRVWTQLTVASAPTARGVDEHAWSSVVVSAQQRDMFVTEWAKRRSRLGDFTADYGIGEFVSWFGLAGVDLGRWAAQRGWEATDFFYGTHRVYVSEFVWRELETVRTGPFDYGLAPGTQPTGWYPMDPGPHGLPEHASVVRGGPAEFENHAPLHIVQEEVAFSDASLTEDEEDKGDLLKPFKDVEHDGQHLEVRAQTLERKLWVGFTWMWTWWIPSFALTYIGGMRRRDVRMAWREKVVIFWIIFLFNAGVIFYMIVLGRLICPNYDKVWNHAELGENQGTTDFYVGIHGQVYDITKFYTKQHSDTSVKTSASTMLPFAGQDISGYFPMPLTVACPSLVTDESIQLVTNTTLYPYTDAMHSSGPIEQPENTTALHDITWYHKVFEPAINNYYKGQIVETPKKVSSMASSNDSYVFFVDNTIYDVTDYMSTISRYSATTSSTSAKYSFFPSAVENIFEQYQGEDATEKFAALDSDTRSKALECLNARFVYGYRDFRHTAKCQAANVILLVIAGLLTSITAVKFLASIRFGPKALPADQDKFVVCQVPVYTEGEDEVRLAIDSLTNLKYDNRRKLLFLMCDGMVTGAGNELPTPQIVLDILGVPDSVDPEPRAYHAIAEGSRQLNYAKVYSGLYEHEGDIVPFIVVVKIGAPTETNKPGNRGKRDSQLLLMNFLNRVHRAAPMSPLDLELFQHISNIIGVEPERYEYLFTVDADTCVAPDSLTRLVAACTADNAVAAVCGETGIQNEQQSLSTMVQVYEYFISHHLTKAFESMFSSVTCLPGCFSLYRLRTAGKYRPLFISDDVIRDYSLRHVDTLHKKNLFSLGEDRYLTTLMSKHFSRFKFKFVADARCATRVPSEFAVLLSQRRRWINSTVHNLAELLRLDSMCGFFIVGMRGIVFVDLIGTLMLPSVVVYLVYLIYVIASKTSPLPIISIILIGAVYGLQALVFILHRRWQHVFWMIVYILAYPLHSFILPIYSFWNMDNFGWGNTRIVLDESKGRKVVLTDDHDQFDARTVPFEPWSAYAERLGLPGAERSVIYDDRRGRIQRDVFDPFTDLNETQTIGQAEWSPDVGPRASMNRMSMAAPSIAPSIAPTMSTAALSRDVFDQGAQAQIRSTVQQVLVSSDLDTMTPRQLRDKVADLLGVDFSGERASWVDSVIDEELENLDDV